MEWRVFLGHSFIHSFTRSASTSLPPTFLKAPSYGALPAARTDAALEQKTSTRNSLPAAGAEPRPHARCAHPPSPGSAPRRLGRGRGRGPARRLSYLGNRGRGGPDVTGGAPPHCGTRLAGRCASSAVEPAELLRPLPGRREPLRAARLALLSVSIPRARCGGVSSLPGPRGSSSGLRETEGCSRAGSGRLTRDLSFPARSSLVQAVQPGALMDGRSLVIPTPG